MEGEMGGVGVGKRKKKGCGGRRRIREGKEGEGRGGERRVYCLGELKILATALQSSLLLLTVVLCCRASQL